MSAVTQNKLVNSLMLFASPGGPWFPSREIRNKAMITIGIVFPEGHNSRRIVHFAFRIFQPRACLSSLFHYSSKLICCKRENEHEN
jgi:hypothetical protein